jgi:periplasmic protein TonB
VPFVRRFASALGLSIAIHAGVLLAASTLSHIELRPAEPRGPSRMTFVLGSSGSSGGGSPSALATALATRSASQADRVNNPATHATRGPPAAPLSPPAARHVQKEAPGGRETSTARAQRQATGRSTSGSGDASGPTDAGASSAVGGGGGSGRVAVAYEQSLAAWLDSHKYYPANLRRRGIEGEGKLRIRIARSGRVLAIDVAAAFSHPSLEAISQDWVWRAQPFPPVPEAIPGDDYVFIVPVGFRLQ